jgi:hypothetical protein
MRSSLSVVAKRALARTSHHPWYYSGTSALNVQRLISLRAVMVMDADEYHSRWEGLWGTDASVQPGEVLKFCSSCDGVHCEEELTQHVIVPASTR